IHSNFNNAAFLVTGSYPEFGEIRSLNVGVGRFYNWDDEHEFRRVAFLGTDAAKQLFPEGRNQLGDNVYLNEMPYLVIGVMAKMTDRMNECLSAIGFIKLFLGGIGKMKVMMVAVRERTREIVVRVALDAPANAILHQFFIEAIIIALVSGVIGLGVAYGLCTRV